MKSSFLLFSTLLVSLALAQQCDSGSCCNKETKMFSPAGTPCPVSSHPCLEASATCDGLSNKCPRKFKADGTACMDGGACQRGLCYKNNKPLEAPNKSYAAAALRTVASKVTEQPKPAASEKKEESKEENKDVEFEDPVLVHEYQDNILDSLRHLPELAQMRQKKHEVEEKKLKAFRKLTHLVIRKHTETLEKQQMFHRHGKVRLQDEMQDVSNLHRHLHLHHKQNHGLDTTGAEEVEKMTTAMLQAANTESGPALWTIVLAVGLCVVAVVLVAVIVVNASKAAKAKPAKRDYY